MDAQGYSKASFLVELISFFSELPINFQADF
jgi:hypothetical protein